MATMAAAGPGQEETFTVDFMEVRPELESDAVAAQLREAENVLSSYSEAKDFLSEALQNATDAIDARRHAATEAQGRITIDFNRQAKTVTVTDTGTGISSEDLQLILSPNVSLKSGRRARSGTGRSRGHKGIGLTFLALAADHLRIRTCDGEIRSDLTVNGGHSWVRTQGRTEKPVAQGRTQAPDSLLGSETYTQIHIASLDLTEFDDDLFATGIDDLIWLLRTRTAVGNTRSLFGTDPDTTARGNIDVELTFTEVTGRETTREVPYSYASPAELIPANRIIEYAEIEDLDQKAIIARVRGNALRYVGVEGTDSGRAVSVYMLAIDGRDMREIFEQRQARGEYVPVDPEGAFADWQGFWVAARDMPAGVSFQPNVIQPRTYERRMFMLLQDDELRLDIGRKSLAGSTTRMLRGVVKSVWEERLRSAVTRMTRATDGPDAEVFAALVHSARERDELGVDVPYRKRPLEPTGVLALFHEVLSHGNGYLPALRTLQTGILKRPNDSIVLDGKDAARHVLFSFSVSDLVKQLEAHADDESSPRTADLAVVWNIDQAQLAQLTIEATPVDGGTDGATHELRFGGLGGIDRLRVVALETVLDLAA